MLDLKAIEYFLEMNGNVNIIHGFEKPVSRDFSRLAVLHLAFMCT